MSSGSARRQFRRTSRTRNAVAWHIDKGRKAILLEFTESFLRFWSSKPIVSGKNVSLLKLAFSSSSNLHVHATRDKRVINYNLKYTYIEILP